MLFHSPHLGKKRTFSHRCSFFPERSLIIPHTLPYSRAGPGDGKRGHSFFFFSPPPSYKITSTISSIILYSLSFMTNFLATPLCSLRTLALDSPVFLSTFYPSNILVASVSLPQPVPISPLHVECVWGGWFQKPSLTCHL